MSLKYFEATEASYTITMGIQSQSLFSALSVTQVGVAAIIQHEFISREFSSFQNWVAHNLVAHTAIVQEKLARSTEMFERETAVSKQLTSLSNLRDMQDALVHDVGRVADEVIYGKHSPETPLTAENLGLHLKDRLAEAEKNDEFLTGGIDGEVSIAPLLNLITAFAGDSDFNMGIGCLRLAQMRQQRVNGSDDNGLALLYGCAKFSEDARLERCQVCDWLAVSLSYMLVSVHSLLPS